MIVLHAAWEAPVGRLALWAEDGRLPRTAPALRGRPPRRPRPKSHPFALDADGIRLAVTELGGLSIGGPERWGETELILRLPDAGAGPVGSPWLEDQPTEPSPEPSVSPELPPWTAPGLIVEWTDASDVLSALMAVAGDTVGPSTTDESGIALAADFRFAARAAEMVLEWTTRGRVLPSLELTDDGWQARWRPLIDGADRGRVEGLMWSLPATFLAAGTPDGSQGPASGDPVPEESGHALRSLMWGLTDALARRFVPDRPLGDRRRGPRTRGPVDAWMAALTSPDGSVQADHEELAVLAGKLDTWQATATTFAEPVRTCFRIIPPAEDSEDVPQGAATVVERNGRRRPKGRPEQIDEWRIEFALAGGGRPEPARVR